MRAHLLAVACGSDLSVIDAVVVFLCLAIAAGLVIALLWVLRS